MKQRTTKNEKNGKNEDTGKTSIWRTIRRGRNENVVNAGKKTKAHAILLRDFAGGVDPPSRKRSQPETGL